MMIEKWCKIQDYENYFISTSGNVKNALGNSISFELSNAGYYRVHLSNKRKAKHISVHRLVAQAFIPNPDRFNVVNHKDGNKLNNCVDNLEWSTHSNNLQHAYNHKLRVGNFGEKNGQAKLTQKAVDEIRTLYKKQSRINGSYALGKRYNVSSTTILDIVKNKKWNSTQ